MTSITIGRMGQTITDEPPPVVKITREPAGIRLEVNVQHQTQPGSMWVGRTIPCDLALELAAALDFLNSQTGRV